MKNIQSFHTLTIQLDTDVMARNIYAASALDCYLRRNDPDVPALLTPDVGRPMNQLIHNAASFVIMKMLPMVTDAVLGDPDSTIISLTVRLSAASGSYTLVRHMFEQAVTSCARHMMYTGVSPKLAETCSEETEQSIAMLIDLLTCPEQQPAITPSPF